MTLNTQHHEIITIPTNPIIIPSSTGNQTDDWRWMKYFSIEDALQELDNHLKTLPSDSTPEQYTRKAYTQGLNYFLAWATSQLMGLPIQQPPASTTFIPKPHVFPSKNIIKAYMAHLIEKGLSASSITARYLPVLVHYLQAFQEQVIHPANGEELIFVSNCRIHLTGALNVKRPKPKTTSNLAPLYQHRRLELAEVNAMLRSIDDTTLQGKRDYTLLRIAFESALRVAEIRRMKLSSITKEGDCYLITVRGKGGKIDPVPVSSECYDYITGWVNAFNDGLPADDPRRITKESNNSLWQPLQRTASNATYREIGKNNYDPAEGISVNAIQNVIKRESLNTLGEKISAHCTRRTAAYLAHQAGMDITMISSLLRHSNTATTWRYVGRKIDHANSKLTNFVQIG